ncbi:MAG: RHS repeat-associated core domain-containing protein [Phycisphaerales bacterium]
MPYWRPGLIDETSTSAKAAVLVGTVFRLSTSHFNESGTRISEQRAYHLLSSFPGSVGTNYDATKFGYDPAGRRLWTRDATGTITTTLYDALSRYSGTEVGTNDYVNTETWRYSQAATNNMTKVAEVVYDGSGDTGGIGNGHVTRRKAFLDSDSPALRRNTDILYDYRGRGIVTLPAAAPYTLMKFDNLGRALAVAQYSSTSGLDAADNPLTLDTNRMALSETAYDQLGRAFKTTRHAIDPADGSDDDTLVSENWYSADGLLIKTVGEMVMKYEYDRLNRPVIAATMAKLSDADYAAADDCAGDIVAQESWTFYESTDCDNVLMSATIERFHTDLDSGGGGTTGHLNTETSVTGDVLDKSKILGRLQIHAAWFDSLNRPTTSASYGTAGIDGVGGGSNFDRSGTSEPTDSSSSILRTKTVYNDNGTVLERSDVHNREARMLYDDAGRVTCEIANYTGAGTPIGTAARANDVYTRHVFTSGLRTQMYSDINGDGDNESGGDPTTEWDYGVTKAGVVGIASEQLLSAMTYPDGSGSDKITYTYNAQGEQLSMEDQAETKHTYTYDGAGRRTADAAVTIAGGLDTDVERIEWAYDGLGRVSTITQFDDDAAGDETDQVKYTYGIWGTITKFEQDHDDVVTPASSGYYSVAYTYEKETSTRRTIRRATMTLPDGGTVTYEYLSTGNKLDDDLSRVSDVKVSSTVVADYLYNGVATPVRVDYAEPGVYATYAGGSAGSYTGWDTFNRPIVSKWTKDLGTDRDFYRTEITWGASATTAGLVTVIDDKIQPGLDVLYSYDNLDRLTQAQDGTWNGSSISSEKRQQDWGMDQFGNFVTFTFDFDGNNNLTGGSDIDDSNVFDGANKITSRTSNKAGGGTVNTAHTVPGAVTDDARSHDVIVYDAWNRFISSQARGSAKITATYRYDGLGHRITWHDDATASGTPPDGSDPVYHVVYTEDWRMLAVYRGSDSDPKERHVPHFAGLNGFGNVSQGGIDGVILRDKDASTAWSAAANGLDERRYICQNWRGDVSALITDGGIEVEWAKYTSYGEPISIPAGDVDGDFDFDATDYTAIASYGGGYDARYDVNLDESIDADDAGDALNAGGGAYVTTSGFGKVSGAHVASRKGYAGYEHDRVIGSQLTHVRHRAYRMDLGRFMQPDPLGYVDGVNRWGYGRQAPHMTTDHSGLCCKSGQNQPERPFITPPAGRPPNQPPNDGGPGPMDPHIPLQPAGLPPPNEFWNMPGPPGAGPQGPGSCSYIEQTVQQVVYCTGVFCLDPSQPQTIEDRESLILPPGTHDRIMDSCGGGCWHCEPLTAVSSSATYVVVRTQTFGCVTCTWSTEIRRTVYEGVCVFLCAGLYEW